jgi:hypothetical protein
LLFAHSFFPGICYLFMRLSGNRSSKSATAATATPAAGLLKARSATNFAHAPRLCKPVATTAAPTTATATKTATAATVTPAARLPKASATLVANLALGSLAAGVTVAAVAVLVAVAVVGAAVVATGLHRRGA